MNLNLVQKGGACHVRPVKHFHESFFVVTLLLLASMTISMLSIVNYRKLAQTAMAEHAKIMAYVEKVLP